MVAPQAVKAPGGVLDLDKQFLFYHAYHKNFTNQAIHIVCVWPILWTALVLLHHAPAFCRTPSFLPQSLVLNPALLATILYMAFYIALEVNNHQALAGLGYLAAAMALGSYITAGYVRRWKAVSVAGAKAPVAISTIALGVHVSCWIAQFIGHGVFEGRAPALLDNLVQAFFMAPLFVIMESFNFAGWQPAQATVTRVLEELR